MFFGQVNKNIVAQTFTIKKITILSFVVLLLLPIGAFATDPAAITATDAETDGANGFTELEFPFGVDTFTISGSTYAIVVTIADDGVQIINISDPTNITATDAETEGANGFTELDGAYDVDTFTISGSTYAIVTAETDDGVQIINISNPAAITATDAETDTGLVELDGASGVDTFTISGSTYAIVASVLDDGVQIFNISDPTNIIATDAETDGANGFTELDGARFVKTFTISGSTYAIVTAETDDGVQIINISDPTNIIATDAETDTGQLELDGAMGVDTFTISGSTYAIVASVTDDGVQIFNISDPTNIIATDAETDAGQLELDGARGVATFTISGSTYAIVTAEHDNGVQIINISDPTNITATDAETDGVNGFSNLGASGVVATFTISGSTYAIVTAASDNGVQIIKLYGPTTSSSPNSDGCSVCIPPTIGLDNNGYRIIENGFTLNQNPINVENFKQNHDTIFANTGDNNTLTLNIYEEMEIQNIKYVAIYLGLDSNDIYSNLAKIQWTNYNGIEKIIITDKNNILTNISVNTAAIPPRTNSAYVFTPSTPNHSTLNVTFEFSSNIPIPYSTIAVQVRDTTGNQMVNYFEDVFEIKGEPLVPVSGTVLQDGTLQDFVTEYNSHSVKDYVLAFDGNEKQDDIIKSDVASTFVLPALFTVDWSEFGFSDVLQNRIKLSQDTVIAQNKIMMIVNENVATSETLVSEIATEKPRVEQYLLDEQNIIAQKKMTEILNLDILSRHNGKDIHNWN